MPVAGLAYPQDEEPEPVPVGQFDAVALFLAALADSALRFLSLARIEDELTDAAARERFGRYVENLRGVSTLCVLVRVAAAALRRSGRSGG